MGGVTNQSRRGRRVLVVLTLTAAMLPAMPLVGQAAAGDTPPTWDINATVSVTNVTATTADLAWPAAFDDNDDVAGYRIYANGSLVASTTGATSTTVTGLAPDTFYTVRVEAYDGNGNESEQLGGLNYGPRLALFAGHQPHSIDIADVDNDGELDLAIAARGDNAASILLGNGNGTFQSVARYPVGPGGFNAEGVTGPKNLALGYFDADSYLDIVAANQDLNPGYAGVILNNGDGTFGSYTQYLTSYGTHDVAVGDFNNDTKADFMTVGWDPPVTGAQLWLGDGDGTFSSSSEHPDGTSVHGIVAADFDDNSNLDVAVSAHGDSAAQVLVGAGNATFAAPVALEGTGGGLAHDIAMGDFDEDNDEDLVIAQEGSDEVTVFLGSTGTTFGTGTAYTVADEPKGVSVGDVNNDGHDDLIAASVLGHYPTCPGTNNDPLTFWFGNGSGGFTSGGSVNVGEAPFDAAVADFNGDGWNDLAAPSWCDDTVSIYLNLGTGGPVETFTTDVAATTVPGTPSAPAATAGDAQATVNWSAPSNGGSAITGYDLQIEDLTTPGTTTTGVGPTTSKVVTALTNGDSYRARVRASNAVGDGSWSAWSATFVPVAPTVDTFDDDDGSIFETDIEWLAAERITLGCNPPTNNLFCPDDPVTRGQMAAFLVRALGLSAGGSVDFVDDNGSIFEADIEKLAAAGITLGCNPPTNDRFCPDQNVTRAQMAAFLRRALSA